MEGNTGNNGFREIHVQTKREGEQLNGDGRISLQTFVVHSVISV